MVSQQQERARELSPSSTYLDNHSPSVNDGRFLTPHMRSVVVSWMVEVAEEFRLQGETLHQAVSLLDRFLSNTQAVPRDVLQLLAVCCVWVASKDLEVAALSIEQLVSVAAYSFKADDLRRMERILLSCLDFRVSAPTAFTFLHLMTLATPQLPASIQGVALYVAELSLLDYQLLSFSPSEVAASALLLSMLHHDTARCEAWRCVQALAGSCPERLQLCAEALLRLQQAASCSNPAVADLLLPVRSRHATQASAWASLAPAMSEVHVEALGASGH